MFLETYKVTVDKFVPHKDKVFIQDLEIGARKLSSGLIIPDDDMSERGIRARWGEVIYIGENIKDLNIGDYVLLAHGRWTRKMYLEIAGVKKTLNYIDYPKAVLLVSSKRPLELDTTSKRLSDVANMELELDLEDLEEIDESTLELKG